MFGGPYLWRAVVIIAGLGLLASHPAVAIVLCFFWLLIGPLRFVWVSFLAGLGFGAGAGFALRPRYPRRNRWTRAELDRNDLEDRRAAPRARGRRLADYQPFDDPLDMG